MKMISFKMFVLSTVAPLMLVIAQSVSSELCPIEKSIYRDGDGLGFELVFGPPPPESVVQASAVINHPRQGRLYQFEVQQTSGYGEIRLGNLDPMFRRAERKGSNFWVTFFDKNLKSANPLFLGEEVEAPKYVVVAELGIHDYYGRRDAVTGDRSLLLPDAIWIHDRCQ